MLKQRKHSPFDDQSSPDGNHYLRKYFSFFFIHFLLISFYIDIKEDDDEVDDDECSTDGSDNSQKALVFAD
jgi:hypothetical protein